TGSSFRRCPTGDERRGRRPMATVAHGWSCLGQSRGLPLLGRLLERKSNLEEPRLVAGGARKADAPWLIFCVEAGRKRRVRSVREEPRRHDDRRIPGACADVRAAAAREEERV